MREPNDRPPAADANDVDVHFHVSRSSDYWELFEFHGDIRLVLDDELAAEVGETNRNDDGIVVVGAVTGNYVVNAVDPRHLINLADSVSGDALRLVDLPWKEGELVIDGFSDDVPFTSWVGVDWMEIESRWRGRKIGYAAMREVVRLFAARGDVLVTVDPHPLITDDPQPNELHAARERLRRYWHNFGFSAVKRTEILGHDCRFRWPERSWMEGSEDQIDG
jgi:hypothetical protein